MSSDQPVLDDEDAVELAGLSESDDPYVVYTEAPRPSDAGKYHKAQSRVIDGEFRFVSCCPNIGIINDRDDVVVRRESDVPDEYDPCRRNACWPRDTWHPTG